MYDTSLWPFSLYYTGFLDPVDLTGSSKLFFVVQLTISHHTSYTPVIPTAGKPLRGMLPTPGERTYWTEVRMELVWCLIISWRRALNLAIISPELPCFNHCSENDVSKRTVVVTTHAKPKLSHQSKVHSFSTAW